MTQDDLDISGTPLEGRFAAIRETLAQDAGARILVRVRAEHDASDAIVIYDIARRGRAIGPWLGCTGSIDGPMARPLQTIILATIAFVGIMFVTVKYIPSKPTNQSKT